MRSVPAELIWLPSVNSSSPVKRHIKELLGAELLTETKPSGSSPEEEPYVTILGRLELKNSNFDLLVRRWCQQEVGEHQMCLSLDKEVALDAYRTLDEKWIDVDNMSFGTIVGLNKFAEHYGTKEQNMDKNLKFKVANIKVYFQHDIKLMSVYFHVVEKGIKAKKGSAATHRPHRFEFEYSAIDKILMNKTDSSPIDVYFYVSHPPLIYIVELPKDAENKMYENYINQSPDTTYSRVDTFADCCRSDIGLSTVLKLQFSPQKGKSWNAICNFLLNSKTRYYFSPIIQLPKRKSYHSPRISEDQFNCIYALQSVLSRSREVVVQIDERQEMATVNKKLNTYARENPKALEAALFKIFSSLDQKKIVNFSRALKFFYEKYNEDEALSIPENMTEVRRAILTPTRIILLPPQPYFNCRFFREFKSEYAIRLSVKDDNISNLSFTLFGRPKVKEIDNNVEVSNDSLERCDDNSVEDEDPSENSPYNSALEKVRKQLLNGFKVGKRHYELLGCSTSHFREHGILFYAKHSEKGKDVDAKYARKMVGDFGKNVYIPSKYMARLGQVFSQSLGFIHIPKNQTKIEEDITTKRPNGGEDYKFSDGIGKMSESIAKKVFEKMNITDNPSAIQIRYAGCKGMLTQWPGMEDQIIFRESMKKFDSLYEDLDVLKVSKPRFVFLNRPFITILSQLGVPDEVFLKLQNNVLEGLFNSLFSEEYATSILEVFSLLKVKYERIREAGISILQEPFFLSMLKNIFEKNVAKLTTKARIMIHPNKGRTMFGVLDETKTLCYGQVFVQYTEHGVIKEKDEKSVMSVILDKVIVLVTKNPCMHPGDVRKFEAVDVKALHHIKDCIVFPAKGDRPHPDEMAGSDLDGDEYSVIWDKELIFKCDNYDPMDFPTDDAARLNKEIEVPEMVNFFCDYISAGQVGQIATAHLVWADHDSGQGGIFGKRCKDLAYKYSIALDFAKSGKPARLSRDERPIVYPDYLEKGLHNDTYLSKNILGQLYRSSKTVLLGFEGLVCSAKYDADEDLNYPGYENYRESAEEALNLFNNEVDSILQQYGIDSEGEFFSGAIMKTSKYICVKQDLNDLTVIEHRTVKLFQEMQKKFCNEFLNPGMRMPSLIPLIYGEHKERVFQKASAWYMITYERSKNGRTHFGLPWTVYEILYELKKQRKKSNVPGMSTLEIKMNEKITKNFPREENTTNDQMEVRLTAFKIMSEWLQTQPLIIDNEEGKGDYDFLIEKIYNEITNDLDTADSNEELSVYKVVLKYLLQLSRLTFAKAAASISHKPRFLQDKILGLLAFKTVLNIIFRHEFNPSSLIDADMQSYEKVFRIPLSEDSIFKCIIHKREEFQELLKEWTKVDEIELRLKADRRDKWYILFTVKGNKYALYHFQDVIFQDNFHAALKRIV